MSSDNPIIDCTVMQLAWNAWQIAQGHLDAQLSTPQQPVAKLDDPAEKARFDTWWEFALTANFGSIRATCLNAWVEAIGRVAQRTDPDFDAWWKIIVDGQPVIA